MATRKRRALGEEEEFAGAWSDGAARKRQRRIAGEVTVRAQPESIKRGREFVADGHTDVKRRCVVAEERQTSESPVARQVKKHHYSTPDHLALVPFVGRTKAAASPAQYGPEPLDPDLKKKHYYICDIARPKLIKNWEPEIHGPLPGSDKELVVWKPPLESLRPLPSSPYQDGSPYSQRSAGSNPAPIFVDFKPESNIEITRLDDDEDVEME